MDVPRLLRPAPPRPRAPARRTGRPAFTLIEIAIVMAIMTLALTLAVGNYGAWKRSVALDAASREVDAAWALARQKAVSSGLPTAFLFSNAPLVGQEEGKAPENSALLDLRLVSDPDSAGDAPWYAVVIATNSVSEGDFWSPAAFDRLLTDDGSTPRSDSDAGLFVPVRLPARLPAPFGWTTFNFEAEPAADKDDRSGWLRDFPVYLVFLPDGTLAYDSFYPSGHTPATTDGKIRLVIGPFDFSSQADRSAERAAGLFRVAEINPRTATLRWLDREERTDFFH